MLLDFLGLLSPASGADDGADAGAASASHHDAVRPRRPQRVRSPLPLLLVLRETGGFDDDELEAVLSSRR